jgi:PPOX class probable FMN-dependent enzyme
VSEALAGEGRRVSSVDELRDVIGECPPATADKVLAALNDAAVAFVKRSPFLVMSTADAAGNVDSSPKGDAPGFVTVEDRRTLVIPDRRGNKLVFGHQNILANPHVGLLFMIPGTIETLRVNGSAELRSDPDLLQALAARGRPAELGIRVRVEECFMHCGKAFIGSQLWKPETWSEPPSENPFTRMYAAGDASLAAEIDRFLEVDDRDGL